MTSLDSWIPGDPVHAETPENTAGSLGLCGPAGTDAACGPNCCDDPGPDNVTSQPTQPDQALVDAMNNVYKALQAGQSLMVFDPSKTTSNAMQLAHKLLSSADESILMEAERITNGQREKDYGLALDNHERIANLWNGYITNLCESKGHVWATWLLPEDVAAMMVLMKVARIQHSPTRDGLVDIAGYANVISKMGQQRADRAARLAEDVD